MIKESTCCGTRPETGRKPARRSAAPRRSEHRAPPAGHPRFLRRGAARARTGAKPGERSTHSLRQMPHHLPAAILPNRNRSEPRPGTGHVYENAHGVQSHTPESSDSKTYTYFPQCNLTKWFWYDINCSIISNAAHYSLKNFLFRYSGWFIDISPTGIKHWLVSFAWFLFTLWNNDAFLQSSAVPCTCSFWITTIQLCILLLYVYFELFLGDWASHVSFINSSRINQNRINILTDKEGEECKRIKQ